MNPFSTALLKAPKKSRFDFSHTNTVGLRFGALIPTLSQFIIPGDEVSMSVEQICRLAPMPVPTFVPLKLRHDFFFVPLRLLYGQERLDKIFAADPTGHGIVDRASCQNLMDFCNMFSALAVYPDNTSQSGLAGDLSHSGDPFIVGSLFDYLRYPVMSDRNGALTSTMMSHLSNSANPLGNFLSDIVNTNITGNTIYGGLSSSKPVLVEKLFAYHFIWRDWYRFVGIEDSSIFEPYLANGILSVWNNDDYEFVEGDIDFVSASNFRTYVQRSGFTNFYSSSLSLLKYAHLAKDEFTSVRYGSSPTVLIPTGSDGSIPALRQASAIQRFLDIIAITGQRYFDKVKGLFGVEPEGPKDDRVQFLARYQQFIKVGEVISTADSGDVSLGDYAGRGILIDGKYLFKRRFTEHGYLFCISSVIPDVAYSGLPRELTDISVFDIPTPVLSEVGDQSVLRGEMDFVYDVSGRQNLSIGDQFRYYAYKSATNEVHGFFLLDAARAWSPLYRDTLNNIIEGSKVKSSTWNFIFNDTSDPYLYGDRFFLNINFTEYITRSLPKYINYHL